MKKFYVFLMALLVAGSSFGQCVIDSANLPNPAGGVFPTAPHLPHIVRDSLYDQTIQVRIPDSLGFSFLGFASADLRIDSIRLDSLVGMPAGISWTANPAVLPGGGFGCGQFTGTSSDTAGTYPLTPIGMAWAHLSIPLLGVDVDTFQYGRLDRLPGFGNYFVVIDSVQLPLTVDAVVVDLCDATQDGSINAHAHGGSPVAPYTYLWNTGATTYFINNLDSGTYILTVTSGAETVTTSITVIMDPPIVLTGSSDSSTDGTNGVAIVVASGGTPPYTYFWSGGAGTTDTITDLAPGSYRVTVRDSLGCIARDTIDVPGIIPNGILRIGNQIPQLSLFPNPATNTLNISVESAGSFSGKMEAIDIAGRVVYSAPVAVSSGRYTKAVSVEHLSPGTYILQISSQNQSIRQQFVVNH